MRTLRRGLGNERGSMVVIMAVTLLAMLALSALAIDLGSLRSARAEAQRTADAVALAGATAFRDLPWADAATSVEARKRAYEVAKANKVRFDFVNVENPTWVPNTYGWGKVYVSQTQDVTLNVIPDSQKVRVWIRRKGIRTYFAKLLAYPFGHVQSMATAWATTSGEMVNCLKPFVIPDIWYESDKTVQDANGDDYMNPNTQGPGGSQDGESWKYEPASIGGDDYYAPFDPSVLNPTLPQTGYGSAMRDSLGYPDDVGLPLLIKPQTGNGNMANDPERMGNAFWLLDLDPNMGVRDEIGSSCFTANVGDPVPYRNGSVTGPTRQGVDDLIDQDPDATWNQQTKQVENSDYADWTKSPRVVTIGLIDPIFWTATSKNAQPDAGSTFTNFARMFILDVDKKENIQAIFLGPAQGGHAGPTGGTLVKVLQLIQ
jgi:putative Flp pilus-assembly TadE/G-like protein